MKFSLMIVLVGLAACALAAPPEPIPILRRVDNGPNPDGSYKWAYETGNSIKAQEEGEIKPDGSEGVASVRGSYSYLSDDGSEVSVKYSADENGFQPQDAHLPTPPPIPEAIIKALEWIAAHPEEDNLRK